MDQCTHEVRAEYWRNIMRLLRCRQRLLSVQQLKYRRSTGHSAYQLPHLSYPQTLQHLSDAPYEDCRLGK